MIAGWMAWATMLGALLYVAARGGEVALRLVRRPTRFGWTIALAATALLPPLLAARRPPAAPNLPATLSDFPYSSPRAWSAPTDPGPQAAVTIDARDLDRPLLMLWAAATLLLSLRLGATALRLSRRQRAWSRADVDGVAVWLSDGDGPAVTGILRPRIVIPRWLTAEPAAVRALVLDHEQAHRLGRDPALLAFAAVLRTLFPWNAALWALCRRLRLAVELDCDARVIRRGAEPYAYGSLLLAVAERGTQGRAVLPALLEPQSFLERRIRVMTSDTTPRPLYAGLAAALVMAAIAVACRVPPPAPLLPAPAAAPPGLPARAVPAAVVAGRPADAPLPGPDRVPAAVMTPEAPAAASEAQVPPTPVEPAPPTAVEAPAATVEQRPATAPQGAAISLERLKRLVENTYPQVSREGSGDSAVWILIDYLDGHTAYEARRTPLPRPLTNTAVAAVAGIPADSVLSYSTTSYPVRDVSGAPAVDVVVVRVRHDTPLPRPRPQWRSFMAPMEDQDSVSQLFHRLKAALERQIPSRFPDLRTADGSPFRLSIVVTNDFEVLRAERDTTPGATRSNWQRPVARGADWYGGIVWAPGSLAPNPVAANVSVMPRN